MFCIPDPGDDVLEGSIDSEGGFAWWYADLLDAHGNGLVLIPSWGLPFLPGYADAARRGCAPPARQRPSLAISLYEAGRPAYYLLQELQPGEASRQGHVLQFADSTLSFGNGSLHAALDLDAPGGRLRGTVVVRGTPRAPLALSPVQHADHEWCPMSGPARGSWDLQLGDTRLQGTGSAYLDRNAGRASLEQLGLRSWTWARAQLPDRLRIGYASWLVDGSSEAVIVDVLGDGTTIAEPARIEPGPTRHNLWGLAWWPALALSSETRRVQIEVAHRPDDGPFYQRSLSTVHTELGSTHGVSEVCHAQRIDRAWQRPLVRMCLHRPSGHNSIWLPLFAGPRSGRLARLLGAA